jgi:hypothetical protein
LTNRLAEIEGHIVPTAATATGQREKLTTLVLEVMDVDMRKAGSGNGALRQQWRRERMRGPWINKDQGCLFAHCVTDNVAIQVKPLE